MALTRTNQNPVGLGDDDAAGGGADLGAFGVADDGANEECPGLEIEIEFYIHAGLVGAFEGCVFQLHVGDALETGEHLAILVEDAGGGGEGVLVAAVDFANLICAIAM